MRKNLLRKLLTFSLFAGGVSTLFYSCDNDDPKMIATVVTSANITSITTTSATGGGEIVSNGNAGVTASGLVYSNIVTEPTLSEDKTLETASSGAFISIIQGLSSGKKYYVRAYATNEIGTAYGEVVSFTTGNAAPTVTDVAISGTAQVGELLTAKYKYNDAENDVEAGTSFQWYMADAVSGGTGTNEIAIPGATAFTFTILKEQFGKFLRVGVVPKAASGTLIGVETKSPFIDGEPTTITFTYNAKSVTYGIIRSAVTGRKWMDRNLGSPNTPTASDDYANYGDLFQWGRAADGHQLIQRNGPTDADVVGVNGTTSTVTPFEYSSVDNPGNKFISVANYAAPFDWRKPSNENLWQATARINNPCPTGWHVPTEDEWADEAAGNSLTNMNDAFSKLNITLSGYRDASTAGFGSSAKTAYLWTSTTTNSPSADYSIYVSFDATGYKSGSLFRALGFSVRCIKDASL